MEVKLEKMTYSLEWEYKNKQLEKLFAEKGISSEEASLMSYKEKQDALGFKTIENGKEILRNLPTPNEVVLLANNGGNGYMKVFSCNLLKNPSKKKANAIYEGLLIAFPGKHNFGVRKYFLKKWRSENMPQTKDEARKNTLSKFLLDAFPGLENKFIRAKFWETYFSRLPQKEKKLKVQNV